MNIKRILYPTDLSDFSNCALPLALDLGQKYQAEIHCIHVVDEATHQYWMGGATEDMVLAAMPTDQIRQNAQKQLTAWTQQHLSSAGIPCVSSIIIGRPFVEILRYAKEQAVDIIVMATHGRGALASVLMGSVAEKVVRKAPCAVLTIRHPEYHFEMP